MTDLTDGGKKIDNSCVMCGECCKALSIEERIKFSIHFRRPILSKRCPYLGADDSCSVYGGDRPEDCVQWICGVYTRIRKHEERGETVTWR